MAFAATHNSPEVKAHRGKALVLLLMFALMLPISPVWASGESSPTAGSSTAGEASSVQMENGEKKNDLTGFFTIGAIINVLFLGAFLLWARKESQKGKKKKTAGRK